MQIGLYTFAEISKEPRTGHTIAPGRRLRDLMEEIELADQVGLDVFGRFLAQLTVGPMPHDRVLHGIELLGTVVAPAVRRATAERIPAASA